MKKRTCFLGNKKYGRNILLVIFLIFLVGCSTFAAVVKEPEKVEEFPQATSGKDPIYYDFIAKYFYNRGDYKQAIYFYNILIEKYNTYGDEKIEEISWINYEIGFCYLKLKKYDAAKRKFLEVITLRNGLAVKKLAEDRLQEITLLQEKAKK